MRCNVCMAMADFGNASKYLTEAAQLGRVLDNKDTTAFGLAHKSNTLIHMTEYDQAWDRLWKVSKQRTKRTTWNGALKF